MKKGRFEASISWGVAIMLIFQLNGCELELTEDFSNSMSNLDDSESNSNDSELNFDDPDESNQNPDDDVQPPEECDPGMFKYAACLCGNLDKVGYGLSSSTTEGFGVGHDKPSNATSHVGINGMVESVGALKVDGNLDIGGAIDSRAHMLIKRNLRVNGDISHRGRFYVEKDANLGGGLSGNGNFEVLGELNLGGEANWRGSLTCDNVTPNVPFSMPLPCACGANEIIDVAAEVANNSNAQPIDLTSDKDDAQIVLTTGKYYSSDGAFLAGERSLRIEGLVELYIAGDVEILGHGVIDLPENSELDLYIAGSVHKVGKMVDAAHPHEGEIINRALRLYMGGSETQLLDTTGQMVFQGFIYAPTVDIHYTGNVVIIGAIFVNNLVGNGHFVVVHDGCVDPEPEDPDDIPT